MFIKRVLTFLWNLYAVAGWSSSLISLACKRKLLDLLARFILFMWSLSDRIETVTVLIISAHVFTQCSQVSSCIVYYSWCLCSVFLRCVIRNETITNLPCIINQTVMSKWHEFGSRHVSSISWPPTLFIFTIHIHLLNVLAFLYYKSRHYILDLWHVLTYLLYLYVYTVHRLVFAAQTNVWLLPLTLSQFHHVCKNDH